MALFNKVFERVFQDDTTVPLNYPSSNKSKRLEGDGEGGKALVVKDLEFKNYSSLGSYKWQVEDPVLGWQDYIEPASTNVCTHSRNLSDSSWQIAGGTKTQNGTVKSADGTRDVPLWSINNLFFFKDITSLTGNYTFSCLLYSNQEQMICVIVPDVNSVGTSRLRRQISLTKGWQYITVTGDAVSATTRRIGFEARTANMTGNFDPTSSDCLFAVDDIQLEAGTQATQYIPTTTTSASRGAGQVSSGQTFFIRSADSGKGIRVLQTATNSLGTTTHTISKKYSKKYFTIELFQSNRFYGNAKDKKTHFNSLRVFQYGRRVGEADNVSKADQIIRYHDPAHFNEVLTANISSPLAFGKDDLSSAGRRNSLIADYLDKDIIAFCEAQGGSSFTANHWTIGGSLYTTMINRINAFKAIYTNAECIGIFVSGMEGDIAGNMTYVNFQTNMITLINQLRTLYGANIPYIHIGLQDDWTAGSPSLKTDYLNGLALLNTSSRWISNARFVPTTGVGFESNADIGIGSPLDTTHFNVNTHYNSIAPAEFEAWKRIYSYGNPL